jgi:hypothetical protein
MTARSVERSAWIMAAVGLVGCVFGAMLAPKDFAHAWAAALIYWLGWPLGSLGLVLVHALTGGRWGLAIRPQLAAGIATLPLVLPALVPMLLLRHALYPWTHASQAALLANRFYLNEPFFFARLVLYLIVWLALALGVLRAMRHDKPDVELARLAPGGLILLVLTVTFSAIDFTLSMEPHFKSSIYGMLAASTDLLLALSVAVMSLAFKGRPLKRETVRDLGRLLFALLILWAYLDFMQLLIVWNSNLPDEAGWYAKRLVGEWGTLAVGVAALHFLLPFLLLIFAPVQRSQATIGSLAALLVFMEILRSWWIVLPAAARGLSFSDAAAMLALLGAAAALALRNSRQGTSQAVLSPHV